MIVWYGTSIVLSYLSIRALSDYMTIRSGCYNTTISQYYNTIINTVEVINTAKNHVKGLPPGTFPPIFCG